MFCPFINGNCNPECVFYNNTYDERDPQSCSLFDAANMIYSFGFDDTKLSDYIENIDKNVHQTSQNTGIDQTDSFLIKSTLNNIENILNEIKCKLK